MPRALCAPPSSNRVKEEKFKKQSFAISIKLIDAILMPKVLYACETWTNLTKKQMKDLDKLQIDAVTIINSLPQSVPYDGKSLNVP